MGTLFEDLYTFIYLYIYIYIYISILLRMKMFQIKVVEKSNHILYSVKVYFENRADYKIMWKSRTGHR